MKTIKIALGICMATMLLFAAASFPDVEGEWILKRTDAKLKLTLIIENDSERNYNMNSSFWMKAEDFQGLKFNSDQPFKLLRDAGTVVFNGKLNEERGIGYFLFTPNKDFSIYLKKMGNEEPEEKEMLLLTLGNIDRKYLGEMKALGYDGLETDQLVSCAIFKVTTDYVKQVQSMGFKDISIQKLINFKIHGISVDFIKSYHSLGYTDMSADKLLELKIHDVTPAYI